MNFPPFYQLKSDIFSFCDSLTPDTEKRWTSHHLFRGWTTGVPYLSSHASLLASGHCPHPPHAHKEEEILFLLSGEVELILPDKGHQNGIERTHICPGQFVYYPSYFAHTLKTTSKKPAKYLMLKWEGRPTGAGSPLHFNCFDIGPSFLDRPCEIGFHHNIVFEGPTAYLKKLQCHTSTLTPGAGYDPHRDYYDVAIVVLAGEVETLDRRAGPDNVIFYPLGEPHGMRNPGKETAKYIVFEFHTRSYPARLSELTDRQRWRKEMKHYLKRVEKKIRDRRL